MTQTSADAPPHAGNTFSPDPRTRNTRDTWDTRDPRDRPAHDRPAHEALARLREDLFTDAFAQRPLPPLAQPRGPLRLLPAGLAKYGRWAPHGVAYGGALAVFLLGIAKAVDFGSLSSVLSLALCFLVSVPLAAVVHRPVLAYWVSYAGGVVAVLFNAVGSSSWAALSLVIHLLVMTLVVLRTRPRMAAEMWLISFGTAIVLNTLTQGAGGELPLMGGVSALFLVAAAAVRAWRDEHRHAVETETVTAKERAQRTLLEERATIARELHDVVAHHMSVVAIQAEAAPYRVADTPPELAASFATIRENAVAALTELRSILGLVRTEGMDAFADTAPEAPQPTLADLDGLLGSVRGTGLEVEAVVTGAVRPLPQGVELSAYRLVQEALSNALRHSPGAAARVEISYVLGGLGVRVVNGPRERLAKPSPGAGHGVLGMRERVQMLGGEMTADHTEDGGFEVAAFLPTATTPRDEPRDAPCDEPRDAPRGEGGSGSVQGGAA
ncbi:sensor histidine kinase [Streptomyces iconiensis]|uniref:histidine kinase n=1 Tax=Streptomyces iconiensis TaxID=1384038 RepID=A0ABT7A7S3_9ACTN|nr:histidine kinase [Streptomyces iconiensis]MDJ1137386.1 histidine kinase [Streptomyces iconiensis]